jgi:hypothetical protein
MIPLSILAALAGCGGPSGSASDTLVGTWRMHTMIDATQSLDVIHVFHSDGTVATTLNLYTQCSGTTPIPTTTTRTWSVTGNRVTLTAMTPDTCSANPILACLSDTGIPCTDINTETMTFAVSSTMLTLTNSAHGRENGTYTH